MNAISAFPVETAPHRPEPLSLVPRVVVDGPVIEAADEGGASLPASARAENGSAKAGSGAAPLAATPAEGLEALVSGGNTSSDADEPMKTAPQELVDLR